MLRSDYANKLLDSRLREFGIPDFSKVNKGEDEGGCGVTGFASTIPLAGRHIFEPSYRMHNRGNGKGGGIAAVGMDCNKLGVSDETLESHYMLHVALLEPKCLASLKESFISPFFDVANEELLDHIRDYRELEGLEVKPPDVWRAFCQGKTRDSIRICRDKRPDWYASAHDRRRICQP